MRKPIIAGNWKMHLGPAAAAALVQELIPLVKDAACDVVVCPPFTSIPAVAPLLAGTNMHLGAQNMHYAEKGAFTGEISAKMLKELGVEYVIIGHSERRQYFAETDETVNKKVAAALESGLVPILCCGETLEQREAGETDGFVSGQVIAALLGLSFEQVQRVVIAYEPIWAIGTGRTATNEEADAAIGALRRAIAASYGAETSEAIRIQYGGSMNPANAAALMAMPEIDGGLIGGAALHAADFAQVVNYEK